MYVLQAAHHLRVHSRLSCNLAKRYWGQFEPARHTTSRMYAAIMPASMPSPSVLVRSVTLAQQLLHVPGSFNQRVRADTEIDWQAYMEQAALWRAGERDYSELRGGTGPLVYPAGFVYLFAALQRVTGGAVFPAQV